MTRNDFQLIAMVLKDSQEDMTGNHEAIARRFAAALRHLHPRFNTEKFLKACGVVLSNEELPG